MASVAVEQMLEVLGDIEDQIEVIKKEAAFVGISPKNLRTQTGEWPMINLLLAKSNAKLALALLEGGR